MSALTRFEQLDDMFPQLFRGFLAPMRTGMSGLREPEDIRIDLSENDKSYTVRAEIPGAKKDDIRVCVDGNLVSISAEVRNEWQEQEEGRVLVKERYYGSASRSFRLAAEVDDKAAEAKFENGVLKLTLPKRAPAASKTLQIR